MVRAGFFLQAGVRKGKPYLLRLGRAEASRGVPDTEL